MSEEITKKTNEEAENENTEEVKTEVKADDTEKIEAKTENTEKAEAASQAAKDETEVKAETKEKAKPAEKKMNTFRKHPAVWKTAGILCACAVIGLGSGYLGGRLSKKDVKAEERPEMSEQAENNNQAPSQQQGGSQQNGPQGSFGNNQSQPAQTNAILGISVTEQDGNLVIQSIDSSSNAEKAGLKTGDIIEEVDGTKVTSVEEIANVLKEKNAGDTVTVKVKRDNQEVSADVTLIENTNAGNGLMQKKDKQNNNQQDNSRQNGPQAGGDQQQGNAQQNGPQGANDQQGSSQQGGPQGGSSDAQSGPTTSENQGQLS